MNTKSKWTQHIKGKVVSLSQNLILKIWSQNIWYAKEKVFSLLPNFKKLLKIWSKSIWYLNLPWFKDLESNPQVSTAFFPTVGICIGICWHHFIGGSQHWEFQRNLHNYPESKLYVLTSNATLFLQIMNSESMCYVFHGRHCSRRSKLQNLNLQNFKL